MAHGSDRVRRVQQHLRRAGILLAEKKWVAASVEVDVALAIDAGSLAAQALRDRIERLRATRPEHAGHSDRPAGAPRKSDGQARATVPPPIEPGRFVPPGVNAHSWIGFEQRIEERRFRALLAAMESAIESRNGIDARVAMEEARELRPGAPELEQVAGRIALLPMALPTAASITHMRSRVFGAVAMLLFGMGLLVGLDRMREGQAAAALARMEPASTLAAADDGEPASSAAADRRVAPEGATATAGMLPASSIESPGTPARATAAPTTVMAAASRSAAPQAVDRVAASPPAATRAAAPPASATRAAASPPAPPLGSREVADDFVAAPAPSRVAVPMAGASPTAPRESQLPPSPPAPSPGGGSPPQSVAAITGETALRAPSAPAPARTTATGGPLAQEVVSASTALNPPAGPPVTAAAPPASASVSSAAEAAGGVVPSRGDATRVEQVLNRYARAYGRLDAGAAREVWPTVDERALARAFAGLQSQNVSFDTCSIDVQGDRANASCRGQTSFIGKIGNREMRTEPRQWQFDLRREGDDWTILSADTRMAN